VFCFVRAGERPAKIHVHYETQPEYPLMMKIVRALPPLGLTESNNSESPLEARGSLSLVEFDAPSFRKVREG
jgi:hypothetical protein